MRSAAERAMKLLRQAERVEPFVFRPWFDRLTLRGILDWFQPLSRAWSFAEALDYDPAAYMAGIGKPLPPGPGWERGLALLLRRAEEQRQEWVAADRRWQEGYFGADTGGGDLVKLEAARMGAADRFMNARSLFLPLKLLGRLPPLSWDIATPEKLGTSFDGAAADPVGFLDPRQETAILRQTHSMIEGGVRHRWITVEGQPESDGAPLWARVIEPVDAVDPPTLVFLHGISMETDFWAGFNDAAMLAVKQGFRLIRAEGPGHGRRRAPGTFGGEEVLSTGPFGFISYISRHLREAALLIAWARGQGGGPVGLAGVSLGGLTAQKLACASRHWPDAYKPDALMLMVVSGRVSTLKMGGRLAGEMRLPERLAKAGWTDDLLRRYAPLVEPERDAPLPPERIFMLLGVEDEIMPIAEGRALARDWRLPDENITIRPQGHFTAYLGLPAAPQPFFQFLQRIKDL